MPLGDGVGQVVAALAFQLGAFVVQRVAIGLQVIEPHTLGAAALGENQDGSADAGIGFEYAAGQADDAFQLVVIEQLLAQLLMRIAGAEQHTVRHDHRRSATELERAKNMGDEQQLGLLGFHKAEYVRVGVGFVQAAFERRVGQNHVEEVLLLTRVVRLDGFAQGVLVADVRAVHAVQHHVHARDAQHGGIEVETPEHLTVDVLAVGFEQVARVMQVAVFVGEGAFGA